MGFAKGAWNSARRSGSRALNAVRSNFLDASENGIHGVMLGSHSQRQQLVGGMADIKAANQMRRESKEALRNVIKEEQDFRKTLDPKANDYQDLLKESEARIQAARNVHKGNMEVIGGGMMDGLADMGSATWGYVSGADMAGRGWARAGTVAARVGVPIAGSVAVGTGIRYATGGTMTENRRGERDIAGIPFI